MARRDSDLLKHLLLFSQALRSKKVGVTVDNIIDALKGISFIDIQNKRDFYHLIRCSFVSRKEEIEPFDELFEQFWSFVEKGNSFAQKMIEEMDEGAGEKEESLLIESLREAQAELEDWDNETKEDERGEPKDLRS